MGRIDADTDAILCADTGFNAGDGAAFDADPVVLDADSNDVMPRSEEEELEGAPDFSPPTRWKAI